MIVTIKTFVENKKRQPDETQGETLKFTLPDVVAVNDRIALKKGTHGNTVYVRAFDLIRLGRMLSNG